jgi:hypothetical protein
MASIFAFNLFFSSPSAVRFFQPFSEFLLGILFISPGHHVGQESGMHRPFHPPKKKFLVGKCP